MADPLKSSVDLNFSSFTSLPLSSQVALIPLVSWCCANFASHVTVNGQSLENLRFSTVKQSAGKINSSIIFSDKRLEKDSPAEQIIPTMTMNTTVQETNFEIPEDSSEVRNDGFILVLILPIFAVAPIS